MIVSTNAGLPAGHQPVGSVLAAWRHGIVRYGFARASLGVRYGFAMGYRVLPGAGAPLT